MSLISIRARYDGKQLHLLEDAPVDESYEAVVVFLKPVEARHEDDDLARFWNSFGSWQDERPIEATLHDIREARTSKSDAPAL